MDLFWYTRNSSDDLPCRQQASGLAPFIWAPTARIAKIHSSCTLASLTIFQRPKEAAAGCVWAIG
jgi:hypothetical protein